MDALLVEVSSSFLEYAIFCKMICKIFWNKERNEAQKSIKFMIYRECLQNLTEKFNFVFRVPDFSISFHNFWLSCYNCFICFMKSFSSSNNQSDYPFTFIKHAFLQKNHSMNSRLFPRLPNYCSFPSDSCCYFSMMIEIYG